MNNLQCRTCLKITKDSTSINLCEENCKLSYIELLKACVSVNALENDSLPQQICKQCSFKLKEFYEFKIKCHDSDTYLRNKLLKQEVTIDENFQDLKLLFKIEIKCEQDETNCPEQISDHYNEDNIKIEKTQKNETVKKSDRKKKKNNKLTIKEIVEKQSERQIVNNVINCDFCNKLMRFKQYKSHVALNHPTLECCDFKYKNIDTLMWHLWTIHKNKKKIINCLFCDRKFRTAPTYKNHLETVHKTEYNNGFVKNKKIKDERIDNEEDNSFNLTEIVESKIESGKPIKCHLCDKTYSRFQSLKAHLPFHTNELKFECKNCNKKFLYHASLHNHKKVCLRDKLQCKFCDRTFLDPDLLKRHTLIIHEHFSCDLCEKKFTERDQFRNHLQTNHSENLRVNKNEENFSQELDKLCDINMSCKFCCEGVLASNYKKHIKMVHSNIVECCSLIFENIESLMIHLCDKHKQIKVARQQSNNVTKPQKDKLVEKSKLCPHCGMKFFAQSTLWNHMLVHRSEKGYECPICGKKFKQASSLYSHRRLHSIQKNYHCEICGASFHLSSTLKRHSIVHSDERNFPCPKCEMKFKDKYALNSHNRSKHSDTKYPCEFCEKSYKSKRKLAIHRRKHTGEEVLRCELCLKGFSRQLGFDTHMKMHEHGLIPGN